MANYATLKAAISQVIKENGNKEITGAVMQTTLLAMVDSMASGYTFAGVATPSTSAGTPDENVFWIGGAGSYSNFGASTINVPTGCICVFTYNGSFASSILYVGGVVDISKLTNTSYASLSQALADVPSFLQVGGLEVMYQDSTSGNFVKYRLMTTSWSTTVSNWQGVDETPVIGSKNTITSGGVYKVSSKNAADIHGVEQTIPTTASTEVLTFSNPLYIQVKQGEKISVILNAEFGVLSDFANYAIYGIKADGTQVLLQKACRQLIEYVFTAENDYIAIGIWIANNRVEENGSISLYAYIVGQTISKDIQQLSKETIGTSIVKSYSLSAGGTLNDVYQTQIKKGELLSFVYTDAANPNSVMGIVFKKADNTNVLFWTLKQGERKTVFAPDDIAYVNTYKVIANASTVVVNIDINKKNGNFVATQEFAVTANQEVYPLIPVSFDAGDTISVKLNTGFCMTGTIPIYYVDMNDNAVLVNPAAYVVHDYKFTLPCKIKGIRIWIAGSRIPSNATYEMRIKRLNNPIEPHHIKVSVANNNLYSVVSAITDCSIYNPYIIELESGTYNLNEEFTPEMINSANYTDDGFVGFCLPDGMSLIGQGKGKTIVSCSIPTTYSASIRNAISTLNNKGNNYVKGITFKSENIRYAVHDDYYYSIEAKHTYDDCEFIHINGTGGNGYGTGLNSGSDIEFRNCFFYPSFGVHTDSHESGKMGQVIFKNSQTEIVNISDYDQGAKINFVAIDSKIGFLNLNNAGEQRNIIEGYGCPNTKIKASQGYIYEWSSTTRLKSETIAVCTALDINNVPTDNKDLVESIVIGNKDGFAILQHGGWFNCDFFGFTANEGDKVKINSSNMLEVASSTETNYISTIVSIGGILYFKF